MTQQTHTNTCELCPHLAAAALWMSKHNRPTRGGKRPLYARAHPGLDHSLAL